jgi:heptosyltransferase I
VKDGRQSILIIKLSSIGDCIHCSAAVRRLREARPHDHLVWMVEPKSRGAVEGSPFVDEVLVYDRAGGGPSSPRGFRALRGLLAPHGFDVAIDFQGLARSGLMALASGARTRIAFLDSREGSPLAATVPWSARTDRQWVVHRYMELLEPLGIPFRETPCHVPVSPESEAAAEGLLRAAGLTGVPLLALALRGSWPSKFWLADRWSEVARIAHERWGMVAALLGGPADREDADRVLEAGRSPMLDVVGKLPLGASMALVRRSAALVGPDTGMIYASMAFGVPTVSLFGPSDPLLVAPRGPHMRTIYHALPCSPCFRKPTCTNYDCMLAITVDEVVEALAEALRG